MKNIVIGMLAHVDAGKTTLSEGLLYEAEIIRRRGRVDNQDTFLDTDKLEKARGITIFSKQAVFTWGNTKFTLLDTPGHVDFSAEMERALAVLDYAVLLVSGADGVQARTRILWKLLEQYQIPVFIFVNKMDRAEAEKAALFGELQKQLSGCVVDFGGRTGRPNGTDNEKEADKAGQRKEQEEFAESLAMCDERCMEEFLENGEISCEGIAAAVRRRHVFPCIFGSALRQEGVRELLDILDACTFPQEYPGEFGARVYKISRDAQGNRLTCLKVTGGSLSVKQNIDEEKVNQIRVYSGVKYETPDTVPAGTVCAVTGLSRSFPGQGMGTTKGNVSGVLEPVLSYRICPPAGVSPSWLFLKLKQLEEEEPTLDITWNEQAQEIYVKLMGEVQTEILQSMISERFGIEAEFDEGGVLYKETIKNRVEGVGHFEPLRHYAEVHLIMEPGERGSRITISARCSEDVLDGNWQRLIMTHLAEREHKGVLTGSALTDVKITLAAGRAHIKHTEGGDFRQAVYRAVRQGLMQAESVLLEPFYGFTLDIPMTLIGRAMTDIERMSGVCGPPMINGERAVLSGRAPVSTMKNYQKEVNAYSRGEGQLVLTADGYDVCHNPEEVIEAAGYNPDSDLDNPSSSVFCAQGAGFTVLWNEVKDYMHLEPVLLQDGSIRGDKSAGENGCDGNNERGLRGDNAAGCRQDGEPEYQEPWIDRDEVDSILARTSFANSHDKDAVKKWSDRKRREVVPQTREYGKTAASLKETYLLVDGYNIIFAWEELRSIATVSIDGARGRLLDILCNYQGIRKMNLIVVFDAYRVSGHKTEYLDYHNIHVVYTKEAETADRYIERFAHENGKKYDITVATSDGLEQIIIRGQGCRLLSARDFEKEVAAAKEALALRYGAAKRGSKNYLAEHMPEELKNNENNL